MNKRITFKDYAFVKPGSREFAQARKRVKHMWRMHPKATAKQIRYWSRGDKLTKVALKPVQQIKKIHAPPLPIPLELWGVQCQISLYPLKETDDAESLGWFITGKRWVRARTEGGAIAAVKEELIVEVKEAYLDTQGEISAYMVKGKDVGRDELGMYENPLISAQPIDKMDAERWDTSQTGSLAIFARKRNQETEQQWNMFTNRRQRSIEDYLD